MTAMFLVPIIIAIASAAILGFLRVPIRPAFTVILLTGVAVVVAGVTFGVALLLVVVLASRLSFLQHRLEWCQHLTHSHELPIIAETGAAALAVAMIVRGGQHVRDRRLPQRPDGEDSFVVLPSERAAAYALPGRPGRIVVTVGMLRALDGPERRALLAHEQAHLRYKHHRYVALASLAAAILPVLAPVAARVRYATERWADEVAAATVGDRAVVARALARASLAANQTKPIGALAMSDEGAVARVRCLLGQDPPRRFGALRTVAGAGLAGLAVAGLSMQAQYVFSLVAHVCDISG
jgi:Zn-dependent protease with chaperone function